MNTKVYLWAIFSSLFILAAHTAHCYTVQLSQNTTLSIVQGDITDMKVDAIVNAANQGLQGGDGVCGSIFKAAGNAALQEACNNYRATEQGIRCPTGQACITPAFNLEKKGIKKIIHAVGPDCRIIRDPKVQRGLLPRTPDQKEQRDLLYSAYYRSLEVANAEYGHVTSIAFPFISSAIYRCPKKMAASTALEAIQDYFIENPQSYITQVYMVVYRDRAEEQLFITTIRESSVGSRAFTKAMRDELHAQSLVNQNEIRALLMAFNDAFDRQDLAQMRAAFNAKRMLLNRVPTIKAAMLAFAPKNRRTQKGR